MRIPAATSERLPGALPVRHVSVGATQLVALCQACREQGGRLVTLWGEDRRSESGFALCVLLEQAGELTCAELALDAHAPTAPDVSTIFPSAARLQRATYDLVGIRTLGGDARPWLRHQAWHGFPLRQDYDAAATPADATADAYPFVTVQGDGVHEIPVGPVHAGTIEPGHFRFSVVGEKVLRLEERLGYVHKGIEKRFAGASLLDGARLAARVSGDSTVAYSWAYAMAAEALTDTVPSARALALRGVLLERERIANHLGDLGALGNDAGLAFGLAQFSLLKEDLLRANAHVWEQRYPMNAIVPGGVCHDLSAGVCAALSSELSKLDAAVARLRDIYDNHAGLQDRFIGAGRVTRELAETLGLVGLAARASGLARDWRTALPAPPLSPGAYAPAVRSEGDVAARVALRFDEIRSSIALCRAWLDDLPAGVPLAHVGPARQAGALGIGGVEGWRGPVVVALRLDDECRVLRCHPHDPSWHNWPALEHAIIDNIVPDFPLINKSFNLSYSGHDL